MFQLLTSLPLLLRAPDILVNERYVSYPTRALPHVPSNRQSQTAPPLPRRPRWSAQLHCWINKKKKLSFPFMSLNVFMSMSGLKLIGCMVAGRCVKIPTAFVHLALKGLYIIMGLVKTSSHWPLSCRQVSYWTFLAVNQGLLHVSYQVQFE